MDNLERLRVFHAIAQAESFTKAAELLHLTQPGLSKHIKHLEEELGVPLFDRMARKVSLTSAGEILYEAAREVIASVASAEQRIQELAGLRRGRLRVGASFPVGLYVLPRLLAAYRKQYPDIKVTLAISTTANIEAKVLDNKIDFGLVSADVQHPKLLTLAFMTDELVVIVPPEHKWAHRRNVRAQELSAETFIVAARGAGARATVEERLKAKGIALQNVLDFVNAEGVKHAVEAGLGISIQPRGIVQREIEAGSLAALRLADMDSEIQYVYICRKKQYPSSAQRAFVEMLANRV
jgi:LysR family transcriptional regulator, transcriptional activator of the cysJI operon